MYHDQQQNVSKLFLWFSLPSLCLIFRMSKPVVWIGRWICHLPHDIPWMLYIQVPPFTKDPGVQTTLKIHGRRFFRNATTFVQSYRVPCPRYSFRPCCFECSRVLEFKTPSSGFQFSSTDLKFCFALKFENKYNVSCLRSKSTPETTYVLICCTSVLSSHYRALMYAPCSWW